MQFEERILPLLPSSITDEILYFIQDEFANKIVEDSVIKTGISGPEMMRSFNEDRFCPVDGEIIKSCDKLAAFIEASLSIRHGIRSHHLLDGKAKIYEEFRDQKPGGIDFGELFDYFYQ